MDADVVVVGAGAVGTSAAYHLAARGLRVAVVEKEPGPALHQSGRNSGVVHAGYNLKPGSLKARFCVEGARRLVAYCRRRGVPLAVGGILVVATTQAEEPVLRELDRRATLNGVRARLLSAGEIADVEPEAAGAAALHAPDGASFDARAYVHALAGDAIAAGARFLYDTPVRRLEPSAAGGVRVRTAKGDLEARLAVNCAGLHADRLAAELAHDVRVLPFRGYYAELRPGRTGLVRSHLYAAPDLAFPFLGVHLSRRVDGRVLVGPGAMLALGREAYRFHEVQPRDALDSLLWPGLWGLLARRRFRQLVGSEIRKSLGLRAVWDEARRLVPSLRPADLVRSYAGNRAQLVSRRGELLDDLVVRETPRAVHVLNAVSPGLTASLPFGDALAGHCAAKLDGDDRPFAPDSIPPPQA